MSRPRRVLGPSETAARALPLDADSKRGRVAVALGRAIDEGAGDSAVSIGRLARRCRRHRMETALTVQKLIDERLIERVFDGGPTNEVSRYVINPAPPSDGANTKEKDIVTEHNPREAALADALRRGALIPASLSAWRRRWDHNPAATRAELQALPGSSVIAEQTSKELGDPDEFERVLASLGV